MAAMDGVGVARFASGAFAPAMAVAIAEIQRDQESSWLFNVPSSMHQTLGGGGGTKQSSMS